MSNQVKDMTWREVQERLREFPVVIVPIGSTEQHGYHLPIGTDVYLAEALAEKTAEKTGALVYPSIHFGYSWSWRDRIGTVTIRQDILREILKDVVRSVERYGVKILIFMNGHEANRSLIKYAIREIQDETDVKVLGMFYPGMEEIYDKYMETPTWGGMFHACEFETSLMLAVKPETVHMERGSAGISCQTDYVRNGQHIDRRVERFGNIRKSGTCNRRKRRDDARTVYRKYICCYRGMCEETG